MVYSLKIWDDARVEIIKGYNWYESKKITLGEKFIYEVEEMLKYLEKYPEHYQIKHKNKYREAVLKKFPYIILYEIIGNTVIVYAVFPSKNNPNKKPR